MYEALEPYRTDPYELAAEIRSISEQHPGRVYQAGEHGCLYTEPDGAPGCIVGQAMANLGKPLPAFKGEGWADLPGEIRSLCGDATSGHSWTRGVFQVPNDQEPGEVGVIQWLRRVQARQDGGSSWADAVATGDSSYPNADKRPEDPR